MICGQTPTRSPNNLVTKMLTNIEAALMQMVVLETLKQYPHIQVVSAADGEHTQIIRARTPQSPHVNLATSSWQDIRDAYLQPLVDSLDPETLTHLWIAADLSWVIDPITFGSVLSIRLRGNRKAQDEQPRITVSPE